MHWERQPMATAAGRAPLVLIVGPSKPALAQQLEAQGCDVVQVPSGGRLGEWTRDARPDLILIHDELPDMSGIDACQLLRRDPRIGANVPILILNGERPTPAQRVAAVSAGAWDFLPYPGEPKELSIQLRSYLQAKHNLDLALAEGPIDPLTGLHNRVGLARRARELGALMARKHSGLGCLILALEAQALVVEAGSLLARSTRVSDVVGVLTSNELVVLAPGTDSEGMVRLALRVEAALSAGTGARTEAVPRLTLRAGYDAVANFKYSPVGPVELIGRASLALRSGRPEVGCPWVRRYDEAGASVPGESWTSVANLAAVPSEKRGTSA